MSRESLLKNKTKDLGLIVVFILLIIGLTILSPNQAFFSKGNAIVVLTQTSINAILAMGMMFVILSDGIDLSVGSIVGFSAIVAAKVAQSGTYPLIVPIVLAIIAGTVIGILNGIGIAYGEIPPFIVTLGTMTMFRGLALVLSGGTVIPGLGKNFVNIVEGRFLKKLINFDVPNLVIYFIIVVAIASFVLAKTVLGRRVYTVGGNQVAARVSGINVKGIKVFVYAVSGMLAGFSGLLIASRTGVGAPTVGEGYEMDAIAAVVIGGVSMSGGSGKVRGVVIGALIIAIIANGLDILRINPNYQRVVKGAIIIIAVLLDVKNKKRRT